MIISFRIQDNSMIEGLLNAVEIVLDLGGIIKCYSKCQHQ